MGNLFKCIRFIFDDVPEFLQGSLMLIIKITPRSIFQYKPREDPLFLVFDLSRAILVQKYTGEDDVDETVSRFVDMKLILLAIDRSQSQTTSILIFFPEITELHALERPFLCPQIHTFPTDHYLNQLQNQ